MRNARLGEEGEARAGPVSPPPRSPHSQAATAVETGRRIGLISLLPLPDRGPRILEFPDDELNGLLRGNVLPDAENPPPLGLGHGGRLRVALTILHQLRLPVVGVRDRDRPVLGAPVPEAPVDENGQAPPGEDDVRPAPLIAPRREIDAVPVAARVQEPADRHLGLGVPAPVRPHRPGGAGTAGPGRPGSPVSGPVATGRRAPSVTRRRRRAHRCDPDVSR